MTALRLSEDEKERLVVAANTTPDQLFEVVEQIIDETLDWRPGRWWSVLDADGSLWCGTSSETEARREHKNRRNSTLHREYASKVFTKDEEVK